MKKNWIIFDEQKYKRKYESKKSSIIGAVHASKIHLFEAGEAHSHGPRRGTILNEHIYIYLFKPSVMHSAHSTKIFDDITSTTSGLYPYHNDNFTVY